MWSMVINEPDKLLGELTIRQVQGYAGDIVLIFRSKYEDTICMSYKLGYESLVIGAR